MLAHAALALSLVVRVYDAYGVAPATLASARESAERIMTGADIRLTWARCPCETPVGGAELVVRVVSAPTSKDPGALGFSYVDIEQKSGTLATIFADRVLELAHLAHVNEGELLGRAMAHEIVHLLFGTRDHTIAGLMRAKWNANELSTNQPFDWLLSRSDNARLRQALLRRLRGSPTPATVVAAGAAWPPLSISAP